MSEDLILKIGVAVYLFLIFMLGVLISSFNIFKQKRWFRLVIYILAFVPALIGAIFLVSYNGSYDLAYGEISSEYYGKLLQMGLICFYVGTILSESNKSNKSKILKYMLAIFSILGAILQVIFNNEFSTQIEDSMVKFTYEIRVVILIFFAIALVVPQHVRKLMNS